MEPLLGDGVTFTVRHLGSCGVARPSGEEVTSQAVRRIIQQVGLATSSLTSRLQVINEIKSGFIKMFNQFTAKKLGLSFTKLFLLVDSSKI